MIHRRWARGRGAARAVDAVPDTTARAPLAERIPGAPRRAARARSRASRASRRRRSPARRGYLARGDDMRHAAPLLDRRSPRADDTTRRHATSGEAAAAIAAAPAARPRSAPRTTTGAPHFVAGWRLVTGDLDGAERDFARAPTSPTAPTAPRRCAVSRAHRSARGDEAAARRLDRSAHPRPHRRRRARSPRPPRPLTRAADAPG